MILSFPLSVLAQWSDDEDSICKFGRKYEMPLRKSIAFPAGNYNDDYKLKELRKAVPLWWYLNEDSIEKGTVATGDRNLLSRIYQYYFLSDIVDFDERGDTTFYPEGDKVRYKLKGTYVFDINGDGLPDMIHYPKYYRRNFMDGDFYDIFLQQKDGTYKLLYFDGFICDINFNSDGTLNTIKTFSGSVYFENHNATFKWYTFDKIKNELILTKQEHLYKCQLIR